MSAGPLACVRSTRTRGYSELELNFTFAELMLQAATTKDVRARLAAHPALASLVRHQKLSGNSGASAGIVLDELLGRAVNVAAASRTLEWARHHEQEIAQSSALALEYLPSSVQLRGQIFFVAGYDLGVASPPDIALNVAHQHFLDAPQELQHYATHEAHHLGFLALRAPPLLEGLSDPRRLLEVVQYFTQMEGMAVHAAYAPRRVANALEADADYRVYSDQAHARSICSRYQEALLPALEGRPLPDQEIGAILGAMSSSERLWYRVGALVSAGIEREHGRAALIATIEAPALFRSATDALLSKPP